MRSPKLISKALCGCLAVGVATVLAACSDGNSVTAISSASQSGTKPQLTPSQVAAMVPTRHELHLPLWGIMQPAQREGGPMNNRQAAKETALLDVTRKDLDAAGRMGGYIQWFWDAGCGGTCLGRPLLELRTEAYIFRDEAAASRFLVARASAYRRQNGKPLGVYKGVFVEEFRPGAIGEEAVGFRTVWKGREGFLGFTWRDTIFLFRVDLVVSLASATSLNDKNPAARAVAAARV